MLTQYRFRGQSHQGKVVQGTFNVRTPREAKEYLEKLMRRYQLSIQSLERRKQYSYTVYLPGRRPIKKYQTAYSKEEVHDVLTKLGYTNFKIKPVLIDLHFKPGIQDVMMFIQLSTNMLKDKMSFGAVLDMLADEQTNRTMRETLLQIESQLKAGGEGREVFNMHTGVFGKFPAYMLGIATRSGNIAEVFAATGKFLQRDMEIRKSIRKALISPFFAVLATLGAVGYYVQEIFPSTAELFLNYNMPLPSMTQATLELSTWLKMYGLFILIAVSGFVGGFIAMKRTDRGRLWYDEHIIRLPLIGHLIHKSSIDIYFWVFSTIYTGSGDNIDIIRISAEACRNTWMERQIKTVSIPMMLEKGEAFVEAMEASGVFTRTVITRLRTGQESGNVLQAAQQIAKFYEAETTYKLGNLIEYIQTLVALFIAVVISLLTLISAEIATITPPTGF
ncbi:MAG: type II secretion system F family protein [Candidatus Cloacimonadaceae bacterium]|nr:type II secretion system F family protein [Candidatus Cloacimonadaceae bacterium]